MTEREALKLALEALEQLKGELYEEVYINGLTGVLDKPITAIKETLAQPEQGPVAHVRVLPLRGDESTPQTRIEWKNGRPVAGPLYTTPPQRKPLTDEQVKTRTDEQIEKIYRAVDGNEFPIDFCREIEFAHGIKGE